MALRDYETPALSDYAIIGDGLTAAVVARDGGIDWLCYGRFDGPAVFCRLLNAERGGYLHVAPPAPFATTRGYVGWSNVLATVFEATNSLAEDGCEAAARGDRLRAARRHHRRAHHLAPGEPWRRAQLGLSLYLASRCFVARQRSGLHSRSRSAGPGRDGAAASKLRLPAGQRPSHGETVQTARRELAVGDGFVSHLALIRAAVSLWQAEERAQGSRDQR